MFVQIGERCRDCIAEPVVRWTDPKSGKTYAFCKRHAPRVLGIEQRRCSGCGEVGRMVATGMCLKCMYGPIE